MFKFYLSLGHIGRVLLMLGALSLSTAAVTLVTEILDRADRGVGKRSGGNLTILISMSGISLFSFLTLYLIYKGVAWYMAYPASVLAALVFVLALLFFFGSVDKLKAPKRDKRVTIGHIGLVYKTVYPDDRSGCVSVDVFGSTIGSYAISATDDVIQTGSKVKIIDVDDDVLVCSPITDGQNKKAD